jgi:hypothetical protein
MVQKGKGRKVQVAARNKRKGPEASRPIVPGYEFSAKKEGLLSWEWAADRLKKSRQYWIATTRPDGAPHLMVIWYSAAIWVRRRVNQDETRRPSGLMIDAGRSFGKGFD